MYIKGLTRRQALVIYHRADPSCWWAAALGCIGILGHTMAALRGDVDTIYIAYASASRVEHCTVASHTIQERLNLGTQFADM